MARDRLTETEIEGSLGTIYESGKPYCWVMSYGWCIVGFYIEHISPLIIRVAHANHFHQAHKDYGALMRDGGSPNTEWRYEGNNELTIPHIIRAGEYGGKVPRGPVK